MSATTITMRSSKKEILAQHEALSYKVISLESRTFTWGELFSLLRDKTQQSWAVHLKESGAAVRDLYSAGQQTRAWFETVRKELTQPLIR
jgi:hypothetical protein